MKRYIFVTILMASMMLVSCSSATIGDNLVEEKIFIAKQIGAGDRRDWSNGGSVSAFNEKNSATLYIYRGMNTITAINDFSYLYTKVSPNGNEIIAVEEDLGEKHEIYKIDIKSQAKTLYFESGLPIYPIKWCEEGVYLLKSISWEDEGREKALYLLKPDGTLYKAWSYEDKNYIIEDIFDNWILYYDFDNKSYNKYSLETKEVVEFGVLNGKSDKNNYYQGIDFYNSADKLIGTTTKNDKYEVFIVNKNSLNILCEGMYKGLVIDGFAYKQFAGESNDGDIYVKVNITEQKTP